MKLTKNERAAIIGMILGDGYLQATGKRNARLRLEHRADHRAYLEWKIGLVPKLFQGKARVLVRQHPATRNTYRYVRHQSNSSPYLGKLRRVFYPQGKKRIPLDLHRWMVSPLTMAIWYLDDGYYFPRDRCAYLYLGRVDRQEAETASRAIAEVFGVVNTVVDKKQKGFALYFSPHEAKKLAIIVRPYVVPVMAYKIPS